MAPQYDHGNRRGLVEEAAVWWEDNECLEVLKQVNQLLDRALALIEGDQIEGGCRYANEQLRRIRHRLSPDIWHKVTTASRTHPVFSVMLRCPYIRYAFEKPRGYAGDAILMDMIYRQTDSFPPSDAVSRRLSEFWINHSSADCVRRRRRFFGNMIDETAATIPNPKILSVACGHFRELDCSAAVRSGNIGQIVGLDYDDLSLAHARAWASSVRALELVRGSALDLIVGDNDLGHFDLIYSAGLYDYLDQPMARRLTASLTSMLNPRGALVIANFLTDTLAAASLEYFMDWWLRYRTEAEMQDLASAVPLTLSETVFWCDTAELGYVRLRRA